MHGRQYHEWQEQRAESYAEDRHRLEAIVEHEPETRRQVRDHFATLDVPGTPDLRPTRMLDIMGMPDWCGTRKVHDARIERGEPLNGVARSDDHIGYFEVELPFEEIAWDDVRGKSPPEGSWLDKEGWQEVCHDCGCHRAIYVYSATHHIAGYERVYCPDCDTEYAHEEWG